MQNSTFKHRLNSTLKDNAINRYVTGKKKGKLDFNSIYKIALSNKVFKQKEERKGKDYSITLLLDGSMSMHDRDYVYTVTKVSEDFSDIFTELNIPNSIYVFANKVTILKDFQQKKKNLYNDYCETYNRDNWSTQDALALHIVGNEITKKNKKNILIVLTDGEGDKIYASDDRIVQGVKLADLKNTKSVINGLHKKHPDLEILCLALGNQKLSTYAKSIYGAKRTVVINNVDDARSGIIKLLNIIIKKA